MYTTRSFTAKHFALQKQTTKTCVRKASTATQVKEASIQARVVFPIFLAFLFPSITAASQPHDVIRIRHNYFKPKLISHSHHSVLNLDVIAALILERRDQRKKNALVGNECRERLGVCVL